MEKLNVRFSDTQRLRIEDVTVLVDLDFSKVARAAMRLGINQLIALGAVEPGKAKNLVVINDLKAK